MSKPNTAGGVEDPRRRDIEVLSALVRLRNTMEDQRGPQRRAVRALIARAQNAVKRFVKSPEEVARYKTTNSRVQYYQRLTTLN